MKLYTKPEIEISVFATEDIITASDMDNVVVGLTESTTPPTDTGVGIDGIDYNNLTWN